MEPLQKQRNGSFFIKDKVLQIVKLAMDGILFISTPDTRSQVSLSAIHRLEAIGIVSYSSQIPHQFTTAATNIQDTAGGQIFISRKQRSKCTMIFFVVIFFG